jgi:hypothetical protein
MKNGMFNEIMRKVEDNLPAILTGVGVATGITTIGYSIFAGWKIKEAVDDKELDKKQKRTKVIKLAVPVIGGAAISATCHIVAHKKSASKLAGAMALYGATKIDSDKFKEEAKKLIGEDRVKDIEEDICKRKVVEPLVPSNGKITIRDDVIGYTYETTLIDFWESVNKFNEEVQSDTLSIASFYEDLLGKDYDYANTHDHVTFGYGSGVASFRPSFSAAMMDDMHLIYCISYEYSNSNS